MKPSFTHTHPSENIFMRQNSLITGVKMSYTAADIVTSNGVGGPHPPEAIIPHYNVSIY